MYLKHFRLEVCIAVALLLFLPIVSAGAEEVVVVKNYGDSLQFFPQIESEDMILTVTGPCNYLLRRSLIDDGELIFKLDETTIDGRYRFEVTVIPRIDGAILEVLKDARKTGDNSEVENLCREGALPGDPTLQAAMFTIDRARIVYDPEASEKIAGLDGSDMQSLDKASVLTNSNGVIRNSLCVGFDCPDSPSFDDTTVLLMENNTRIKFDDTSSLAGFPNRDWEIQANANASGGGNYFAVNDCGSSSQGGCAEDRLFTIEGNAPQHSLYVDDGGRIGNRTSNPVVEIHSSSGDTPTLRLEQNTSSGFAAQTWDIAGNETNFFVRDATNGSTLPFRIFPTASSNSLVIDADNDIGVGTTSPDARLDIQSAGAGSAVTSLRFTNTNGPSRLEFRDDTGSVNWDFRTTSGDSFVITQPTSPSNDFLINNAGNVTIRGTLVTGGGGTCDPGPCDGVFVDYPLESIEQHAEFMWENKHLWGVGPTPEGQPLNLSKKTTGILHELEKAHIYIEQLNGTLQDQDQELKAQQGLIQELQERLTALENRE